MFRAHHGRRFASLQRRAQFVHRPRLNLITNSASLPLRVQDDTVSLPRKDSGVLGLRTLSGIGKTICASNNGDEMTSVGLSPGMDSIKDGSSNTFLNMGLSEDLCRGLEEMRVLEPTKIQEIVIPEILKTSAHAIVSSETGSGKTLAFLLPIIHKIKLDEKVNGRNPLPGRPKALVLVPTRELAVQVYNVAKQLSHTSKFRPFLATGGAKKKFSKTVLKESIDIMIGTPTRVLDLWLKQKIFLGHVLHVAIDEADTLLGNRDVGGFADDVTKILSTMTNRKPLEEGGKPNAQLVFVGATVDSSWEEKGRDTSKSCMRKIVELVEAKGRKDLNIIKAKDSKLLATGIKCNFISSSNTDSKHPALAEVIKSINISAKRSGNSSTHTLVFCNSIASCRSTTYYLEQLKGHNDFVGSLHGGMPPLVREDHWQKFVTSANGYEHRILVCTDIASRGLDFEKSIDNIILFDLPRSFSDFAHRAGRTARGEDATGNVYAIIGTSRSEKHFAEKMKRAMRDKFGTSFPRSAQFQRNKLPSKRILSKFDKYSSRTRKRIQFGNSGRIR